MKHSIVLAAAAAFVVFGFGATPASAQLLGGLLGGGGGDVVGGLLGGSGDGGLLDLDTSDGDIGVSGVVTVGISSGESGTSANGTLLGGGGESVSIPLGSVLGGNSGVTLTLPGLGGGIIGGEEGPQGPAGPQGPRGINGFNGGNGIAGINGNNGGNGSNGFNGLDGISGSSKLKTLMKILENRAWLRFAQGNKVCLPAFGVASINGWLPQKDYGALQQVLNAYGADIQTLQDMLKRCRIQSRGVNVGQVIGVDFKNDGSIIVYTL